MMNRIYGRFFGLAALMALAAISQGCFTFTTLSSGRTLGKGGMEVMPSLSSYYVEGTTTTPLVPQLSYTYGVSQRWDVGLSASLAIIGLHTKYQLIGDQQTPFCLAAGLQYNYFGVRSGSSSGNSDALRLSLSNLNIPIYTSWHPKPNLALMLTPKLIHLGGRGAVDSDGGKEGIWLAGLSPGFEVGRRFKLVAEVNLVSPLNQGENFSSPFSTFALGMKFRFDR